VSNTITHNTIFNIIRTPLRIPTLVKDKVVTGYFIDDKSKVTKTDSLDDIPAGRSNGDRNVFYDFEQAQGSLGLSMLSQQIADVNQGWYPKW
jgi:hypothetical protein